MKNFAAHLLYDNGSKAKGKVSAWGTQARQMAYCPFYGGRIPDLTGNNE
jgi:hypothetical protein